MVFRYTAIWVGHYALVAPLDQNSLESPIITLLIPNFHVVPHLTSQASSSPSFPSFSPFPSPPSMEDSSFLQSPTSPGPTSPRLRPIGPRTRRPHYKSGNLGGGTSPSDETVPAYSGRSSPALTISRPQSPFLPSMPSFSQLSEVSFNRIKPPITIDKGIQVAPSDISPPPSSARASSSAVKVIRKPPTLNPPPPLNFETTPIQYRGLTLEAAQWTFTSDQLQDIVSRAIRQTAHESFIRLVSTKTLDEELVQELERLDHVSNHTS